MAAKLQHARHVMRGHDDDTAPGAMRTQKSLKQIDAAAVEHAVRLVEQQELRLQKLPLGDGETALHAAGEVRHIVIAARAEIDGFERLDERRGTMAAAIERSEKAQIFAYRKIFVQVVRRRQQANFPAQIERAWCERGAVKLDRARSGQYQPREQF